MGRFALSIAIAACGSAWLGCSTGPGGPDAGCMAYVSTADLGAPVVSFAADVMPIFRANCALTAACHGDPSSVSEHRPFLGYPNPDAGTVTGKTIIDGIVGVKSDEDLLMDYVAAGDPKHSFLMHKLDDDQCTLVDQCMMGISFRPNCGVFMPYQAPDILDVHTRDTIRRWIAQGAGDN